MPEFCTCGAQLPPDARFCHKCGKPQRDEPHLAEIEPTPPPPLLAPPPEPPRIGFHNRTAVWVALRVGVIAFLFSALPGFLSVVGLIGGGFLAVYLYRRRTGQRLSLLGGAHLGWLAGLFGFLLITLIITFVAVSLSVPEVVDKMREQRNALSEADLNKMIELFRSPASVALELGQSFLAFTLLLPFGGALGAKLLGRDGSTANHGDA